MLTAFHLLRRVTLLFGLAAVLAVSACTSSNDGESTGTPLVGDLINVHGNRFDMPPTVEPGATITIRNKDDVAHSVTAELSVFFDTEVRGGETVTFTAPSSPGSYPLHCRYHPAMRATLVVAWERTGGNAAAR